MPREITIKKIHKRDGRIVDFEKEKIANAIYKAAVSIGGDDKKLAEELTEKVVLELEEEFHGQMPSVEEIQDLVERVLIKEGHAKTAKAYILYRKTHADIREAKATILEIEKTISGYLDQTDWRVNENSNTAFSFSGLMLHTAGKVISNYSLNHIYAPAIAEAHRLGYMHIHDLRDGIIGYCAGWSLKNLLIKGFGGVPGKITSAPAKHLDVLISQMVNYLGTLQMEFAGAQAFSSVDTLLAPFVKKDKLSFDEVKQNMQRLIFSLNIASRWGSQAPFTNLTFDWTVPEDMREEKAIIGGVQQDFAYKDCQKEMDMINRAFLEVMREGDAVGRIFTFPIPTYNLTRDFDWDGPNTQLLFEVTAKYGIPYFQNYIGSNLDPKSIRAMCCRLNLNTRELMNRPGGMWGPGDSTGSIGVVTLNMNRLGYEAENKEDFFKKIQHYMVLAKDALEIKRKIVSKNLENGLMPYTREYLGSFKNYFSTIGLCGMNEACLNLLGQTIASPEGKQLAIETLEKMRELIRGFQEETGNLYNLEATPAESTSYRLARLDKEVYPDIITAGVEEPYLTNSTQLPVDQTDDAIEAIQHQKDIQPLYTGGTIFHTFLGEEIGDPESCKQLVRKIATNTKLPYFSITPTFSICKNHGYVAGEHFDCPHCGSRTEVYSRVVGYFRPVQNWNKGKKEEFRDRLEFDVAKAVEKEVALAPVHSAAKAKEATPPAVGAVAMRGTKK